MSAHQEEAETQRFRVRERGRVRLPVSPSSSHKDSSAMNTHRPLRYVLERVTIARAKRRHTLFARIVSTPALAICH